MGAKRRNGRRDPTLSQPSSLNNSIASGSDEEDGPQCALPVWQWTQVQKVLPIVLRFLSLSRRLAPSPAVGLPHLIPGVATCELELASTGSRVHSQFVMSIESTFCLYLRATIPLAWAM